MNIIKKARISADKRSIDAYGRSVELAIANYLLDNGSFPTDISQLSVEYSGDRVECSTTQLNSDSTIYLAGCTVEGRNVEGYIYGKEGTITYNAYSIGDEVTYNNVDYYVLENSDITESSVTLLKKTPLTTEEVNLYGGVGTENNHVNVYSPDCPGTSYEPYSNGYGKIYYYSSSMCNHTDRSKCTVSYTDSEIKYVVDAWKVAKASAANESRLITYDELIDNFGFELHEGGCSTCSSYYAASTETPSWLYSDQYSYWTMSQARDSNDGVWAVAGGRIDYSVVFNIYSSVRPVITINKSYLN